MRVCALYHIIVGACFQKSFGKFDGEVRAKLLDHKLASILKVVKMTKKEGDEAIISEHGYVLAHEVYVLD